MRIVVVCGIDGAPRADALQAALGELRADCDRLDLSAVPGETALARMAGALREAEEALTAAPSGAVAVTGDDDHSLAAALVATKLQIPLYRQEAVEPAPAVETTARVTTLLADSVIPSDPAEAAAAIVELAAANAPPAASE
jgi:hypothetical protein